MTLKKNPLEALSVDQKNSIEKWYTISVLSSLCTITIITGVTCTTLFTLRTEKSSHKKLLEKLATRAPHQSKKLQELDNSFFNKNFEELMTLCTELLPAEIVFTLYKATSSTVTLTGTTPATSLLVDYIDALKEKKNNLSISLKTITQQKNLFTFDLLISIKTP